MYFLFLDQYVKHKIIDVYIEREDGNLGIVLRGGAHPDPDMCKPLIVTHVRPDGPADRLIETKLLLLKNKSYKVENVFSINYHILKTAPFVSYYYFKSIKIKM